MCCIPLCILHPAPPLPSCLPHLRLSRPARRLAAADRMEKAAGKRSRGGKAKKQRASEHKKRIKAAGAGPVGGADDGGKDLGLAPAGGGKGHQRNPKAFVFSGRGKAKRQAARSAEKDQRRMHGAALPLAILPHGHLERATGKVQFRSVRLIEQ